MGIMLFFGLELSPGGKSDRRVILVLLLGFLVYTGHGTPPSERTPNAAKVS